MNMSSFPRLPLLLGALALLLLGAAAGYWLAPQGATHQPQATSATTERKVLYWQDPMVPGSRFDKPGKSPYMDMDLEPVYADEVSTEGTVKVAPDIAQSLGVRLGRVERTALPDELRVVGTVGYNERLLEIVPARVEGVVRRLHVRAPLEQVRRGQALADIYAPMWHEAQQEYLALLDAQSATAQSLRAAARARLEALGVPAGAIARIESQRRVPATTTLVAPIDGVITELGAREGVSFMAGMTLFRISGLSSVWVTARVPEVQMSQLARRAAVQARSAAWPGQSFTGRIDSLLPEIDSETRSVGVRIALDNTAGLWRPGMFVDLMFRGDAQAAALSVPSEALIVTGTRQVVILANKDGSFRPVDVTAGIEQDGRTPILAGLTEGQQIVLSGQFLIDSEASLRSTLTRMAGQEPQP